ncbi:MAG: RNA polymerase sigma factor [Alicyclobacillus sp.]|nr:RNA polymerase sigma factor [Alicyclobacillus sp.]
MTDAEDEIRAFQAGNLEAFRRLVERHGHALYRLAVWFTHDPAVAQDLVQEVFIKAWRQRQQLKSPDKFSAWLHTILRRVYLDWRRLGQRETPVVDAAEQMERRMFQFGHYAPSPDQVLARHSQFDSVRSALNTLSAKDQEILALRYGEDLTVTEIARRIGMRPGAVATRIHRALAKLRTQLSNPPAE